MVAAPHGLSHAPGWLHGQDPEVLERAAEAFGLSRDALGLLSTLKSLGAVLDQLEATTWASVGLTAAQGWVLAHLVLIGPCSQGVLAGRLMVTPSSISQVTTRLEHAGLVARRGAPGDRRLRSLVATPAARSHVLAVVPQVRDVLETAEAALGPDGARHLLRQLATLHDSLLGTHSGEGPERTPLRSAAVSGSEEHPLPSECGGGHRADGDVADDG
ncbi:MAG: MarR family winged helix-turn-helix transcriptional regulator [Actinomycetes bacterium]|jgi:DNA-binding MarR family transcriptional regulator